MTIRKLTSERLGKLLTDKGLLTPEQLNEALEQHAATGRPLGEVLVAFNYVSEKDVLEVISQQMKVSYFDLTHFIPPPDVITLIPKEMAIELTALPLFKTGNVLTIAMADPLDLPALMKLRRVCQCDVNPVLASSKAIMKTIEIHYPSTENIQEQSQTSPSSADSSDSEETSFKVKPSRTIPAFSSEDTENIEGEESEPGKPSRPRDKNIGGLVQAAKEAPVIRKVNEIIERAAKDKASDIHLQPTEDNLQVRYRIDGVLHDLETISKVQQDPIISRIKIMANIDIAERRLPQDGRIQIQLEKNDADIRVSTFPTIYGESVVMRILIKSVKPPELSELGFSKRILSDFANLIKRPNGIILATGPTGSGKTTTLYAGLSMVNTKDKNIMTLEDPVEYRLEGVRQSQVAPKAGLTFAKGLRSMLRQDPDIIMVGEIRDLETAEIAIHAALTGHLVLSTLHTNDAAGAVARLVDMGIESFLVASSVIGVLAQRLIRQICPDCKEEVKVSESLFTSLKMNPKKGSEFFHGRGCKACKKTGYRGRSAIAELMITDASIRQLIVQNAPTEKIKEAMAQAGMPLLIDDGFERACEGFTTLEEVLRLTQH